MTEEIKLGIIDTIECDGYQKIWFTWQEELNGELIKQKKYLLYFPDMRITTTIKVGEETETTLKQGMDKETIMKYFSKKDGSLNQELLMRSAIYEGYKKDGMDLDEGNVRHFWYTHLKFLWVNLLGYKEKDINRNRAGCWHQLVYSKLVHYDEMNIVGGKETGRNSVIKDSPFNNIIIGLEKMDFFNSYKWLSQLFNCTLMSAGGEPSLAVTWNFVLQLKKLGVDLNQTFYLCTATDYDPSGYIIQENFRKQFEGAIRSYGFNGKCKIYRLFVTKNQLTEEIINNQAMPWGANEEVTDETLELTSKYTRKQLKELNYPKSKIDIICKLGRRYRDDETGWNSFCKRADGGIYIPKPRDWKGYVEIIDNKEMVRAIIEMDVFSNKRIEEAIRLKLLDIIAETNDNTKIMIPEIMRIFEQQRERVIDDVYIHWDRLLIEDERKKYAEDIDLWKNEINNQRDNETEEAYDEYSDAVKEKETEKYQRVPELFNKKDELKEFTDALKEERNERINKITAEYKDQLGWLDIEEDETQEQIDDKCEDIDEDINTLEEEKDNKITVIDEQHTFRIDKYNKFKEEHLTVFNPVEQSLREDINEKLSQDNLSYFFKDLESKDNENTRVCISNLLIEPDLLLVDNTSCFNQEKYTFKGERFLEKASENKDLNIGKVRDEFTGTFKKAMYDVIKKDVDEITFVLTVAIPTKDLTDEIEQAKSDCEKEMEDSS